MKESTTTTTRTPLCRGATRDNVVLGSQNNGIDGAHILIPMPDLISAGKVTQNNVPTPIYILARLDTSAQAISVANERHRFIEAA